MLARAALVALTCCGSILAQIPPAVTKLDPPDGARDVDASTTTLTVEFDRDMNTTCGWSICGGGATFPVIASIAWQDARTLVLEVELAPATRYVMPLNCASSARRLRDLAGRRLPATPWSFTTGDAEPADAAQRARNEAALDELRALIDTEYSYRDRVVEDWDRAFLTARDAILDAATDASWALRAGELLEQARDPHLWIEVDGERRETFHESPPGNYDLEAVERAVPGLEKLNESVWYGMIEDGSRKVGYLLVHSFSTPKAADVTFANDLVDEACATCDALVLDVRPNGGGNEMLAMQLAAWFVEGTKRYASQIMLDRKTGRWERERVRDITGRRAARRFHGPVAVLIGPHCASSCEGFVLMMRQAENAVLVGARTRGTSGNPVPHELSNGLRIWLPSWRALDADGHAIEGVGIAPEVEVATTPKDFAEHDPVLERALELLRER